MNVSKSHLARNINIRPVEHYRQLIILFAKEIIFFNQFFRPFSISVIPYPWWSAIILRHCALLTMPHTLYLIIPSEAEVNFSSLNFHLNNNKVECWTWKQCNYRNAKKKRTFSKVRVLIKSLTLVPVCIGCKWIFIIIDHSYRILSSNAQHVNLRWICAIHTKRRKMFRTSFLVNKITEKEKVSIDLELKYIVNNKDHSICDQFQLIKPNYVWCHEWMISSLGSRCLSISSSVFKYISFRKAQIQTNESSTYELCEKWITWQFCVPFNNTNENNPRCDRICFWWQLSNKAKKPLQMDKWHE